jgi:hypothetical protein
MVSGGLAGGLDDCKSRDRLMRIHRGWRVTAKRVDYSFVKATPVTSLRRNRPDVIASAERP